MTEKYSDLLNRDGREVPLTLGLLITGVGEGVVHFNASSTEIGDLLQADLNRGLGFNDDKRKSKKIGNYSEMDGVPVQGEVKIELAPPQVSPMESTDRNYSSTAASTAAAASETTSASSSSSSHRHLVQRQKRFRAAARASR